MPEIVFDVTEVFSASTGKLRFYGIMRVVQEVAIELVRQGAPVRYGVFSYAHRGFLEVKPRLNPDGSVDLDVPLGVHETRVRPVYSRKSLLSHIGTQYLLNPILMRKNRRAWTTAGVTRPRLDMTGKTLVSASRPKTVADATRILAASGQRHDLIALLYDMIPLHPEFGHRSAYRPGKFLDDNRIILENASALMAISEFAKSEVHRFSDKDLLPPAGSITTIPLVHECAMGTNAPTIERPENPYLLTVGATLGRKNLDISLEALLLLKEQGKPVPDLIIAGAKRTATEDVLKGDRFASIKNNVHFVTSPKQEDLVALYEGAMAVVLASRMEGWGLPAGEALWLGTPAICSTAPVLREVCGDLALYFDPDSPSELAAHIERLQSDPAFSAKLRQQIAKARPHLRTWADVATDIRRTLKV